MLLLGRSYCMGCLERAVRKSRGESKPAPAADVPAPAPARATETARIPVVQGDSSGESRRVFSRFIPPVECDLTLKRDGLRSFVSSNVLRLWVDVSEGGLRAVVQGNFDQDDRVQGRMAYPPLSLKLDFKGSVRHCKPSEKYPGCFMIGVKFENPTSELQSFIREVLSENLAMMAMKPRAPRRPAGKTGQPAPVLPSATGQPPAARSA